MPGLIAPESKILRHPEVLAKLRRGEPVWPLNVEFDLAWRCNAKCHHCDFAYTHDGSLMPTDLALRLFGELAEGGTQAITFSGGGEPTTHPDFARLARAAATDGLKVGLYTNGLMGSRILQAAPSLTWAYISLDAVGERSYLGLKGVDGFRRATKTIHDLAGLPGPTVGMGYLVSGANWGFAELAVNIARDLGADYVQFRPIVSEGADYAWVPTALESLDRLAGPGVYVSRQRFLDLYEQRPRSYTVCRGSALVPCVGADGILYVCVNTRLRRALGDLKVEPFADVWARRPEQMVGPDCRVACRDHALNETLEYVCGEGAHDAFV